MRQSSNSVSSSRSADDDAADTDTADTARGGWVLRATPKHVCILPKIDTRTFAGSVWLCGECGQHWEVKTQEQGLAVKVFARVSAHRYEQLLRREQRSA